MTNSGVVLVTGSTGRQGGSVVRHLQAGGGWKIRALTPNPNEEPARRLASEGIEAVKRRVRATRRPEKETVDDWPQERRAQRPQARICRHHADRRAMEAKR